MNKWTNWAILALFQASKNFPPKIGFVSFENLGPLNFMQNIKKTNDPILRKML